MGERRRERSEQSIMPFSEAGEALTELFFTLIGKGEERRQEHGFKTFVNKKLKEFERKYNNPRDLTDRRKKVSQISGASRSLEHSEPLIFEDENIKKASEENIRAIIPREREERRERDIVTCGLRVLRYIAKKRGEISNKTPRMRFSKTERHTLNQLIESGWVTRRKGIWRSPSFWTLLSILVIPSLTIFLLGASQIFESTVLAFFGYVIGTTPLIVALFGLFMLSLGGTFYSHHFKKLCLPKRTKLLLLKWSMATSNPPQFYGAMEEESQESIREKAFSSLTTKGDQMKELKRRFLIGDD